MPHRNGREDPSAEEEDFFKDPFAAQDAAATNGHGSHHTSEGNETSTGSVAWLAACAVGIMSSFIVYGVLMEYATSGGRKLHEMSLIFVTSLLYTVTAYICRHVRGEEPTTIPKHQMVILGITSMGSTFSSVRSLRYVIYPVQVLAKSCKPIPVMLMGAAMGEKYPIKKYVNVSMIVSGVALFMYSGKSNDKHNAEPGGQALGLLLLFFSLCFDGGTGAYEDRLMRKHHVGPFDLMFNIQFAKTILSGVGLIISGQINYFFQMVADTGMILILLGLSGALGQVFIFVTISKFGALTCSIIGLSRKILTLVASLVIYHHPVNIMQGAGLTLAISAMVINFTDKGGKSKKGAHTELPATDAYSSSEPLTQQQSSTASSAAAVTSSSGRSNSIVFDAVDAVKAALQRQFTRQRGRHDPSDQDGHDASAVELKGLLSEEDDDDVDVASTSAAKSAATSGKTTVLV